jgi:hypothetical protein
VKKKAINQEQKKREKKYKKSNKRKREKKPSLSHSPFFCTIPLSSSTLS